MQKSRNRAAGLILSLLCGFGRVEGEGSAFKILIWPVRLARQQGYTGQIRALHGQCISGGRNHGIQLRFATVTSLSDDFSVYLIQTGPFELSTPYSHPLGQTFLSQRCCGLLIPPGLDKQDADRHYGANEEQLLGHAQPLRLSLLLCGHVQFVSFDDGSSRALEV